MTTRAVLATTVLFLSLQGSIVADNDTPPSSDAAWISYSETPIRSKRDQEFHARATKNTDPKLLKIISRHVARSTDLRLVLKSYSDAELKFRSDKFLVTRIDGTNISVTAGKGFPEFATRKLAKQLHAMGYRVNLVTPETLLQRNDNHAPDEPEFVVPNAKLAEE